MTIDQLDYRFNKRTSGSTFACMVFHYGSNLKAMSWRCSFYGTRSKWNQRITDGITPFLLLLLLLLYTGTDKKKKATLGNIDLYGVTDRQRQRDWGDGGGEMDWEREREGGRERGERERETGEVRGRRRDWYDNTLLHKDKDLSTSWIFCKFVPDDINSNTQYIKQEYN